MPGPHYYYYTAWPRVAPLQCQPPNGSLLGALSLSHSLSLSLSLSLHWCKQSAVWPSSGTELIWVLFTGEMCMYVYINPSWAWTSSFHSSWSSLYTHHSVHGLFFFVLVFLHKLQHIQPQASSAEESWLRCCSEVYSGRNRGDIKPVSLQSENP